MSKRPPILAFKAIINYCKKETDCNNCPLKQGNNKYLSKGCSLSPSLWELKEAKNE